MSLIFRIESLSTISGSTVNPVVNGVTCVVGANNAGKSQLLKDIERFVTEGVTDNTVVIAGATAIANPASEAEYAELLERNTIVVDFGAGDERRLLPSQNGIDSFTITQTIEGVRNSSAGLGYIHEAFVRRISAGALSAYATGHLRTDNSYSEQANWLLRKIFEDGAIEKELSDLIQTLFGIPVFIDRANFPPQLRVGDIGLPAPKVDEITSEYSNAVRAVPTLDEQGDGLRSVSGLALVVLALVPQVLLLDEPESFLHPGQARAVGRWLADIASEQGTQIIVATHDKDFLLGLLGSSQAANVDVVRILRDGNESMLKTIPSEKLAEYRADPVLRYSNVLQGLFHERVIICEGDIDCRFYSAAAEELAIKKDRRHITDNTLFVPSNGKNGVARTVRVLSDLGVNASVIVDFDVLESKPTLEAIVQSLGESWTPELEAAYSSVSKHVPKTKQDFWRKVKNGGLNSVPRGEATQDFRIMINLLAEKHVHIVEGGELEDFYRPVGKGSDWIGEALANEAHLSPGVQSLMTEVIPALR